MIKSREPPVQRGRGGVAAILLAAGISSRMGEPKPLVQLAGRPLLVHALEALRHSDVSEIVVVLGAEADRVRREIALDGTRTIVNPDYAEGMSTSIRAGVRAAAPEGEAFLIVLGDQPLVSVATINALVARSEATGARILVPTYCGVRGNPVLLHRSLSKDIDTIHGDVGCRDVVNGHADEIVEVSVDDPGILIDVDTPEEVRRVEMVLAEGSPLDGLVADRVRGASTGDEPTSRRNPRRARVDIDSLAHAMTERGETFALATVVRVVRPTSGKPGDKAIIRGSGEIIGFVGGSCTGTSVLTEGLKAIRDGQPRLLRLTPEAGLEPTPEGVVEYAMECLSGGILEIYIEPRGPKPTLLIVGPSPIAEALSTLGAAMEYRVVVAAPRALPGAYPDAESVVVDLDGLAGLVAGETYAVVATMGKYDEMALRALVPSPVAYVGLVASRRRGAGVLAALRKAGIQDSDLRKLHSPAGLDLAAKTSNEIALSILAQIVQVRRTAGPAESSPAELETTGVPSRKAIDVVCGMEVDTDTPLRAAHEGTTYYFCSEMCRTRFLESPAAFLA
jgi:xanthine dehydrogenase accessory factor